MKTLVHHPYDDDGTDDGTGAGRCRGCGLAFDQGRGAEAHATPENVEASRLAARMLGEGDDEDDEYAATNIPAQRMPAAAPKSVGLDWSKGGQGASMGAPLPCDDCGKPAALRDPISGKPRHKTCAEAELGRRVDAITGRAK